MASLAIYYSKRESNLNSRVTDFGIVKGQFAGSRSLRLNYNKIIEVICYFPLFPTGQVDHTNVYITKGIFKQSSFCWASTPSCAKLITLSCLKQKSNRRLPETDPAKGAKRSQDRNKKQISNYREINSAK